MITENQLWHLAWLSWRRVDRICTFVLQVNVVQLQKHEVRHVLVQELSRLQIDRYVASIHNIVDVSKVVRLLLLAHWELEHHFGVHLERLVVRKQLENAHVDNAVLQTRNDVGCYRRPLLVAEIRVAASLAKETEEI